MFTHLSGQSIKSKLFKMLQLKASLVVSFFLLLTGCASTPQTQSILASPPNIPVKHEIAGVPFYPQQDFYCGPATLSEVFNYHGLAQTQELLAADLFIPELQGSLQIEMAAAARQQGFLAYTQEGDLSLLFSLVSQNIPVIVLQNVSIPWYPMWHYAVVIGYDLENQEVLLHSGDVQRRVAEFEVFERTWQRGKYWLLAAVPAGITSEHFNPFIYARSAQDLLSVGQISAGITALTSATQQWPEYWLPYFLLGNHFLSSDLKSATDWYQQGYQFASGQAAYLNNYAYSLNALDCRGLAISTIEQALLLSPNDADLLDTQQEIINNPSTGQCQLKNL